MSRLATVDSGAVPARTEAGGWRPRHGQGRAEVTNSQWTLKSLAVMEQDTFERWQALLEQRIGMQLSPERKTFLEASLTTRMREVGTAEDYRAYYELVTGPGGDQEWAALVDYLTIHETRFYRHPSSYALVKDYLTGRIRNASLKSLNIWSLGCATGEEPYSLAMLIDSLLTETGQSAYYGITATDVSPAALSKAREGIFGERKLEGMPDGWREKYFTPLPKGRVQISDTLKQKICFARMNVLDLGSTPMSSFDLIFCQNLLIYFSRFKKKEIATQLANKLAPGGLLVFGVGEVVDWTHPLMERVVHPDTLAYIRRK